MQSEENSDQATQQQNPGDWLTLSLGKNPSKNSESRSESRAKIYSCNYCMRKFYSSQALGGHQNAHKIERGVLRHCQSDKMTMKMMALPVLHASMFGSLGVQPHSLVHKPGRDGTASVARFNETNSRFVAIEEAAELMQPSQQQEQHSSTSNNLDLNLKL